MGFLIASVRTALPASPDRFEFFEQRIRPTLVNECQECHGANKQKSGLRLDSRDGLLKGGDSGPALVPGDSKRSLLIQRIRHEAPDSRMPKDRPRLPDSLIADFVTWVDQGAADPRDPPPQASAATLTKDVEWAATLEARKDWWSFRPIRKPAVPMVNDAAWSNHPVDRFLLARMEERGLRPSVVANRESLLRRVTFALTGLPPTVDEVDDFRRDPSPDAYEQRVDRLLASPRFGERWARHWMDLVRYCESHGSQGDPELPMAWRYRDYLIRAFNSDVPYDQFVREHIAGDLLQQPRLNPIEGLNESKLGPAHLRMVELGYVPVDALDDQVKVVDNQIDVFSKAFLGLTVSCARCHDHKFDPISQKDFYALYGVFASCRPGQLVVDDPALLRTNRAELAVLRKEIRLGLGDAWSVAAAGLGTELLEHAARDAEKEQLAAGSRRLSEEIAEVESSARAAPARHLDLTNTMEPWKAALADAAKNNASPLHPWVKLSRLAGNEFRDAWSHLATFWKNELAGRREFNRTNFTRGWDLRGEEAGRWFMAGAGAGTAASAGEFCVEVTGDRVLRGVYPSGVFNHALTRKQSGVFSSPRFKVDTDSISVRALGERSMMRLVVENYAIGGGGIYPAQNLNSDEMKWFRLDTAYRKGAHAYLEFVTADDSPNSGSADGGRASFEAAEVVFHNGSQPPAEVLVPAAFLLDGEAPGSASELATLYGRRLTAAVTHWREGSLSDEESAFLDYFVRRDLLPTSLVRLPRLKESVTAYRQLEAGIPVPRRAPGVHEAAGFNQPRFVRGQIAQPGEPVPRRFLEVFNGRAFPTGLSGRLELAGEVATPANPLTARVMVNRVWHHLFGRGLVGTVDNFGRLGEKPTHPELLDYLASRFIEHGWSLKDTIRFLVTSRAFQQSTAAPVDAAGLDPGNELLSHARVRRLEAEAIRDAVLAVSGQLDLKMYGPGVNVYYVGKTEGGGPKGPLDGDRRRSVYQRIRRNAQNPFLEAFDTPKPASTRGRRDTTNVPAQSLTMLNDPFIIDQAAKWAKALVADGLGLDERVKGMFVKALAREATEEDLGAAHEFLGELAAEYSVPPSELGRSERVWQDFAQSLFCLKEFIYVD